MTTSIDLKTLLAVLDEIPIGISASSQDGPIYENRQAKAHALLAAGSDKIAEFNPTISEQQLSLSIGGIAHQVSFSLDVTKQRALEDDLFRRAYFDGLTGLPNRGLLDRSVAALIDSGAETTFALAFLDLDGFKNINDYYGHAVGDALLFKIAQRLSGELRSVDLMARVGGDEFVLLLSPAATAGEVALVVDRFISRLREPYYIDGNEIFISASVGVSLYPADGRSYDALCTNADRAMYRIKGTTKGSVQFYSPGIDHAASERLKIEQRLRLAVRDRRLRCAYQPKVDFRTNEVVGVEVLLRWLDEEGAIQPPGDFVNLAVELGLMDEITHIVLAETTSAIDRINDAFGATSTISLNVAARQADEPLFMRSLVDAIDATGFARRFMIELTEEAFLSKSRFQTQVLPMIRDVGARVSIDDFGVGYSSLAALADITADEIKVDRSFITAIHQRPRNQSILKTIESLAEALDMSIIVEGVETVEELLYLQAATRIRLAQGYYFSKPLFLDEIAPRIPDRSLRQAPVPWRTPQFRTVS
ncbi:MAG: diguanylate cyclase [Hyphomicrobiales bacterium]|nr:MAG: diguanylate cyclase [Hyphomicrobiales bacterium]